MKLYIHECFNSYFYLQKVFNDIRKYSVKKKNKVYYLCRDTNVQKLLLKKLNKKTFEKSFIEESVNDQINKIFKRKNKQKIINEAKEYEKKYNINLSFLIGKDRALGRGYLLNVDRYPNIIRSFGRRKKVFIFFKYFKKY